MFSEFGVSANVGNPRVAYKETITVQVKAEGRFVRQSGGHGQYGDCWLEIEPTGRGSGFEFVDKIKGGTIPRNYIPSILKQVLEKHCEIGTLAGYPIVDIKATVFDGSYHEVDSTKMAFKMAGSMALKNGVHKAKPIILEPIMKMEVITPKEFMGDVIGDISSRRAHIESIENHAEMCIISALIPLSETFGYTTAFRSQTQGRASQTMEFNSYQEIPAFLLKELTEKTGMKIMPKQKIRIKIKGFDHKVVDQSAQQIVETVEQTGAVVVGPIPLPTRIEKFSVIRASFIDKNSQEQFEVRTHKRLIDIVETTSKTIDSLTKLNLPSGVELDIKL